MNFNNEGNIQEPSGDELIRSVMIHLPDLVIVVDRSNCLVYINPSGLRTMGRRASEVLGQGLNELFDEERAARLAQESAEVFRNGASLVAEAEFETSTGFRHFEYVLSPIPSRTGETQFLLGTARDITERRRELDELTMRDRAIAAVNGGVVIVDPHQEDSPIIYANPGFERLTGYSNEETVGRNCRFLQGPDTEPERIEEMRRGLRERRPCRVVVKNYRKDGTAFWNDLEISPVFDIAGNLTHFIGVQTDVTERIETQEALATAYRRERRIATMLQNSLLLSPPEHFPGIQVVTRYAPAWDEAQIGGDFYDAFALSGGRYALVVGDASGKGLEAAVNIAEVRFALHVFLRETPDDLARAMTRLNAFVAESRELSGIHSGDLTHAFVCLAVAVVEPTRGHLTLCAAGMEPPLILRADGRDEMVALFHLPLGVDGSRIYAEARIAVDSGDLILLATDGITEARKGRGAFLGMEGVANLARQALTGAIGKQLDGPHDAAEAIMEGARSFAGGRLADDACLLLAHLRPDAAHRER